ncbi:hypothetical protein CROQUDRAFT_44032 [Cronartium quercuum f. sp. fusiforme G11]|uniref:Histidine kinase n=1 Tax=Cronartium quercuum f. sp. fusiforme G11 TaxID=708437 RepID=A0A9P6NIL1_9BASI|nr:hypothetical protein CROQUDRAFT_44032 [Cronartium quercuum f. sp. fusiforme G11]
MIITFSTVIELQPTLEIILFPEWSWRLVVVSYAISWIGAYTTSAIIAHANSLLLTGGPNWFLWIGLASITYGFISIWSLHLIAMTAETFEGIEVSFHPGLTALSALVATFFTFLALISSARSPFRRNTSFDSRVPVVRPRLLRRSPAFASLRRRRASFGDGKRLLHLDQHRPSSPALAPSDSPYSPVTSPCGTKYVRGPAWYPPLRALKTTASPSSLPRYCSQSQGYRPLASGEDGEGWGTEEENDEEEDNEEEEEEEEDLPLDPHSSHLLSRAPQHAPLTLRSLSREVRAGATLVNGLKGFIWGSAIAFMHHIGMKAMEIPSGRVIWNPIYIGLSCSLALVVSWLGCITIDQMDLHLGRQLLFATLTSAGAFGFHYVSALGATFVTTSDSLSLSPPNGHGGFTDEIPFFITGLAVCTCLLSIGLLAHTASLSRNRLAELVFTKRRLWKVRAQKLAAEGAANLKQNFISVASHELRTPLFSVTGYADLLARTDLNEEQKLYLTNMQQACANMQLIIANVLDFSKLERNNAESIAKPVCMNFRAMVEGIGRMTEDRGLSGAVDMIVHVSEKVPETALIDETFVLRICMNLISNALKFTEKGFILISLEMHGEVLVIKVQDTGVGIPRSFRKDLFEPYRQADSSTTRPHQGTGLGLSICKQLVQRLDGKIEVHSVEGEGTTFILSLPLTRPSSPPPPPSHARIGVAYAERRTEAVLANLLRRDGHEAFELNLSEYPEDLDMIWADSTSLKNIRQEEGAVMVVTCAEAQEAGLETVLRSGAVQLRRHGIIPHLIFNLLSNPDKYAHEIANNWTSPIDRRESVGTIVTVNSHGGESRSSSIGGSGYISPKLGMVEEEKKEVKEEEVEKEQKKILLVDDNGMNVELGRRVLQKIGYRVEVAYDGHEAVRKACGGDCELVLMDCQMPGLDGPEATRMIRDYEKDQKKPHLPIIALTANVSESDKLTCEKSGMDSFLPKPLQVTVLKATLHRFLG